MAAQADSKNKNEGLSFNEKLDGFLQKNRKLLLGGMIAVIVFIAAMIAFTTVRDSIREKALSKVDSFSRLYDKLKIEDGSDASNIIWNLNEIAGLMEDISTFARKNSGFAAARSYSLLADIYWDQKNWAEAERAWLEAAKAASKSYLAPVSFYNAAAAAEEQENTQAAIAHYIKALDYGSSFPSAARAQFSIGRLEEIRDRKEAALAAYMSLINNWPNDPIWSNLAQSRILLLSE
jgi:tetratricopeptide (TPR) repeat protein